MRLGIFLLDWINLAHLKTQPSRNRTVLLRIIFVPAIPSAKMIVDINGGTDEK